MIDFKDYLKENLEIDKNQEKIDKERERIESEIFKVKVKKLNNILKSEGINDFSFDIKDIGDHFEFDIPVHVLIGPKTREFCANRWKQIMAKAEIDMDFADEINRLVSKLDFKITMKMNKAMNKEVAQGDIKPEGAE